MEEPKYEPLKMGEKKFSDNYGLKVKKYNKSKLKRCSCGEIDYSDTGECGRCFNLRKGFNKLKD